MRFLIEAIGLIAGGGKELTLDLLSNLPVNGHEFVGLVPDLPEYKALCRPNVHLRYFSTPRNLFRRHHFLQTTVPMLCRELGADALACLGNFGPHQPPCPTVQLVHNPYLAYREPAAESRSTIRERLIAAYGRRSLRRLSPQVRVLVQTDVMGQRLRALYGLDPLQTSILPNSCFFPRETQMAVRPSTRAPDRPFTFLCLTRYAAHKNLEILAEAVKKVRAYTPAAFRCVITISAQQHPGARKLLRRIGRENLTDLLINLGPVRRDGLAELYRSADALIFPTLLESFTRTYHEAMHFGLPILTSDRDFARHLCQDAAIYFDPMDAECVARSMATIMEDAELRGQLVSSARSRLQQSPAWAEIAAQFVAALECAARGLPIQTDPVREPVCAL